MKNELDRRSALLGGVAAVLLPGAVRAETEAAQRWTKLPTVPFPGKQDDVAFGSARRGWYGNGRGLLYRTDDAGDTWRQVWQQPGTFVRALGFLDEQTGILGNVGVGSFPGVTDRTPLYRTTDGGETWAAITAIDGPVPEGICAIDIVRTKTIDRGTPLLREVIHAAGRVGAPAHYLQSSDRGVRWTSTDLSAATAAIFDVKFRNHRTGFIAGTSDADLVRANGLVLRTDDGGRSWGPVYRGRRPMETVWKLHFPTPEIGYGTVQSYDPDPSRRARYVIKTTDGGKSWKELSLTDDARWRSFGVGFVDERTGWVGGNLGGLGTTDGGLSWTPVAFGKAVNKIRVVDDKQTRRVYAIGSELHRHEVS